MSNVVRFARHCHPDCPYLCMTAVSLTTALSLEGLSLFSLSPTWLVPFPPPVQMPRAFLSPLHWAQGPIPLLWTYGFVLGHYVTWRNGASPCWSSMVCVGICPAGQASSEVINANEVTYSLAAHRGTMYMGKFGAGNRRFSLWSQLNDLWQWHNSCPVPLLFK